MIVSLRPATRDDVDQVVAVFLGCWRVSYPGHLPGRLVAVMTDEVAVALWRRTLADAHRAVVVAERDGEVCGLVGYGVDGAAGWVHSLYVAPAEQGRGTGVALLAHAVQAFTRAGADDAYLWVFADNAPSLAFYERQGWRADGEARVEAQFGEPELRMARALDARAVGAVP